MSCPPPPISTSSPAPPLRVSLPALPISTSSPSPPLAVNSMAVPSPDAVMTSSPPRPLMTMRSLFASKLEIVTSVARPDTVTTPLLLVIVIASSPLVALMTTVSLASSAPPRSMLTLLTSVLDRSLTVMVSAPALALTSTVSTLSRSIVMLAISRRRRAGVPAVGRQVDLLVDVGAVEHEGVGARLTIDRVAAVARVPDECVIACPKQGRVVALRAKDGVVALAADDLVIADAAVDREVDLAGFERGGIDGVVAAQAVDRERIEGALGPGERHLRCQSVDHHARTTASDGDGVVAGRAVDDHVVRRAITLAAAHRARQVDINLLGGGSGEIVDRHSVGAAQGVDLDVLDTVEVHGDVGDVAGEAHPLTIGRNVHLFRDVGAVEHQRIGANLALDDVAAVAGIPGEGIVAVAEESRVGAATADHGVVAVTAQQEVVALATGDGVVAAATVDGETDDTRQQGGRIDRVIAVAAVDSQKVAGFRVVDVDLGRQPSHCNTGRCGDDIDLVAAVGPVDGHLIGRHVVRAQIDRHLHHIGPGEVVNGDFVGTAQGVELDVLDVVEVHGDGADIAHQAHPAVIGRDAHGLGDVGAVENQRVVAVLPVDDIATVARIPLENVVASAEKGDVVTLLAVDEVVAIAAKKTVRAVAAEDCVVAGAAVDRQADEGGQVAGGAEIVVAAVHIEDEVLRCADVEAEWSGADAIEAHTRAVGRDCECFGPVAAVDLRRIGAVAAFEKVAAITWVPDHAIVAALAKYLVVARAAGQHVVARAAEQQVVSAFAEEGIVACAAEQLVCARAASEHVVARAAEQLGCGQGAVG